MSHAAAATVRRLLDWGIEGQSIDG